MRRNRCRAITIPASGAAPGRNVHSGQVQGKPWRRQGQFGLDAITGSLAEARGQSKGRRRSQRWNPPFCGDLDMRIAADGTWFYMKTPIGRPALVKLFASVLKREGDKYFLVTPVEKCGITVDDAPFLAVEIECRNNRRRAGARISAPMSMTGCMRARA